MPAGPRNFHIGAGELTIDGEDVGLTTEEGMIVHYEPDVHEHLSGKYGNTPVKATLVGQRLTLEVWIGEHTMDNVELAFAGVTRDGNRVLFGKPAGIEVEGKVLVLTPYDGTPSWHFRNAVVTGAIETAYQVNEERVIHVTFVALIDINAPEDEALGYFMS